MREWVERLGVCIVIAGFFMWSYILGTILVGVYLIAEANNKETSDGS